MTRIGFEDYKIVFHLPENGFLILIWSISRLPLRILIWTKGTIFSID